MLNFECDSSAVLIVLFIYYYYSSLHKLDKMRLTIIILLLLISVINSFIHSPINRRINRIDIKLLDISGKLNIYIEKIYYI